MTKTSRRGYDPQDHRWFSPSEVVRLQKASHEIEWLIDRGYRLEQVVKFVGDRYQFSTRQREALKRATCTIQQKENRNAKELSVEQLKGRVLHVDGFNLIILIEVACSGGMLIFGRDGLIRDLAGLRGTYKIIDKTEMALTLIGEALTYCQPKEVIFYLDEPVSNSKNLKVFMTEQAKEWNFSTQVHLVLNADVILREQSYVISSDAVILDECKSYFNLGKFIVDLMGIKPKLYKIAD